MQTKLYIDGQWVSPKSGKTFDVVDPSNNEVFHQVSAGGAEDINRGCSGRTTCF